MDTIVVATDFSARSDHALLRARLIAGKTGATLTLVHVIDDDQSPDIIEASRRSAMRALKATARALDEQAGIAATPVVGVGDVALEILACADPVAADLIVLGPHRKRASDVFAGTTVERVLRKVAMVGTSAQTILQSAESELADLIMVGTSQRKGFARLLIGSIAEDVIRETHRDILIVPVA